MPSAEVGGNFCEVTGQPNWCDSSMQCDNGSGAPGTGSCQVKNWCVCQWAFASYIERAGGCDMIQDIDCEATNMEALVAYRAQGMSEALSCFEKRCLRPDLPLGVRESDVVTAEA